MDCSNTLPNNQAASAATQTETVTLPRPWGFPALALAVFINSFGVVLMLHAGAGISAISGVPYVFSEVFPVLTLGTWTYIFQGVLVLSLMVLRRQFVPSYLCSFVVGFVFGDLLDRRFRFKTAPALAWLRGVEAE